MKTCTRKLLVILILTGASGRTGYSAGQDPAFAVSGGAIKVKVNLVLVSARVATAAGRPVGELKPDDFRVLENGREQPISIFASVDAPVDVALVVDTSGSTAPHLNLLKNAAMRFVDQFDQADTIGLYAVSSTVARVHSFTRDRGSLKSAVESLATGSPPVTSFPGFAILGEPQPRGGTLLYDGLALVQKEFAPTSQRRVILVFTDALDAGSTTSFDTLNFQTLQGSVTLFTVLPYREPDELPAYLKQRGEKSAGQFDATNLRGGKLPPGSRAKKTWLLVLDLSGSGDYNLDLFQETAVTFLRELAPQARVWLFDYRGKLRPLAFPETGENAPVKLRPLTPNEAENLVPLSSDRDSYPQLAKDGEINLRVDQILILTDRQATGVQEVMRSVNGGRNNASPGTVSILPLEIFGGTQALKCAVQGVIHDPRGISTAGYTHQAILFQDLEDKLLQLSRDTGGEGYRVKKAEELGETYAQIAAQIRSSYTLGYYSGARAGRHLLEVKIPGRDFAVHARRAVVVY